MAHDKALDLPTPYRYKRYIFYTLITIFTWVIPWVTINGNHFFLLSFDHKELHLFFNSFSMQELYLMPFLLMMLFIGIFGITAFGGRMFCGWGCPQTVFRVVYRDLIETKLLRLRKRIKNKQQEPDYSKPINKLKKVVAVLIWSALAFLAAADFIWFFVPPEEFFEYMKNPGEHMILVGTMLTIAGFLIYDIVILKENFCIYVCPYSRIQSVLYDDDTIMAIYDADRGGKIYDDHTKLFHKQKDLREADPESECTACESCVTVCPTHIDIRQGLQLECINCLECVDACTVVMGKLGKPSLVEWSSIRETEKKEGKTRYFRPKIIGYIAILVLLMIGLVVVGGEKEYMQLNINKESRLYKMQKQNGKLMIENTYIFLFENTDSVDHEYTFEVTNDKNIKVIRPSKPFKIKAGHSKKKPVIIGTDVLETDSSGLSFSKELILKIYATDDKERVVIYRKTIFFFPSKAEYEALKAK